MHVTHNVKTNLSLHINDTIFRVNGINREHGKVLNCGNKILLINSALKRAEGE